MILQWLLALLALVSGLICINATATDTVNSADFIITSTEVFSNLFGPGSLTYTETFTFSSTAFTSYGYGTASSTCDSRSMGLSSTIEQLSIETVRETNTSTASAIIPLTTTSIRPVSTLTITVSAVNAKSTATGLCYWGEEAILTPCTDLIIATAAPSITQKSSAISLSGNNIFRPVVKGLMNIFPYRPDSCAQKIRARYEMLGQKWYEYGYVIPLICSRTFCLCYLVFLALLLFYSGKRSSLHRNAVNTAFFLLLIPIMLIVIYALVYARPVANLQNWWTRCREPCALLTKDTTALCQFANNTRTEPDNWEPTMTLPQTT